MLNRRTLLKLLGSGTLAAVAAHLLPAAAETKTVELQSVSLVSNPLPHQSLTIIGQEWLPARKTYTYVKGDGLSHLEWVYTASKITCRSCGIVLKDRHAKVWQEATEDQKFCGNHVGGWGHHPQSNYIVERDPNLGLFKVDRDV